ncbi:MAG: peptide chain release factor N(5)-glutamine methyltransferase [Holophagales bacterium]|jgi:release factor glutamine methyltransferase|nr:peptide chain release factor N(5)-glutamine methyltransferase [Holophagales bacterium]
MGLVQSYFSARKELAKQLSRFLPELEAAAESWRWFEDGLGWDKARLHAHGEEPITESIEAQLGEWLDRRRSGEPMAYILGWVVWRGRRFRVTPATLIPRPETEIVLESALHLAKRLGSTYTVDVGTGSGILGISLALEANMQVTATDISAEAIEVAKHNASALGAQIEFACGDLLKPVDGPIDLVVSNPPYVDFADAPSLQRELAFEPRSALFSPGAGMDVAARLLKQCLERGAKGAVIEIGSGQGAKMKSQALEVGWKSIEIKQDMAKHDRVLIALA